MNFVIVFMMSAVFGVFLIYSTEQIRAKRPPNNELEHSSTKSPLFDPP